MKIVERFKQREKLPKDKKIACLVFLGLPTALILLILADAVRMGVNTQKNVIPDAHEQAEGVTDNCDKPISEEPNPRIDYFYTENDKGKGYIKDVLTENPELKEALSLSDEQEQSFHDAISIMDDYIVLVETRYIEDGIIVGESDIKDPECADFSYAYIEDITEDQSVLDIVNNISKSGFTNVTMELVYNGLGLTIEEQNRVIGYAYNNPEDEHAYDEIIHMYDNRTSEFVEITTTEDLLHEVADHKDDHYILTFYPEDITNESMCITLIHYGKDAYDYCQSVDLDWNYHGYTDLITYNFKYNYKH